MKRLLATCALGLTLAGCNSYTAGFNALGVAPDAPWGYFAAGLVTGVVLFAMAVFARGALR